MKKILLGVLMVLSLAVTAACHTLHGAGEDIESAGHSIERATDKK